MESIENLFVESVWEIEIFILMYLLSIHYKGQRRDDTYTL